MVIVAAALGAQACDRYVHDGSVLPQAAQKTIKDNFKAKVSVVKIDETLGHVNDYEVILTDGTEITFDKSGNWENVETSKYSRVPKAFIPEAISSYVSKKERGAQIVGIEKERNGFEIQLSNGLELKFDKAGQFVRYDK